MSEPNAINGFEPIIAVSAPMAFKLEVIPPETVNDQDFNTGLHRPEELPIPQDEVEQHRHHDLSLTYFGRHYDLIRTSRGLSDEEVYVALLSPAAIAAILGVSNIAVITGRIPEDDLEDILDIMERQKTFPSTHNPEGWFARLDLVSLKDATNQPLKTPRDLAYALAMSTRAHPSLKHEEQNGAKIYFLPWDSTMTSKREFRVFCPPSTNTPKITAISQYTWHSPFLFSEGETAESICSHVVPESQRVLDEIHDSKGFNEALQRQGFTFDIRLRDDGRMELIELNAFGALTGCGSCLFHWIRDFQQLYYGTSIAVRLSI
jgi:hypothetical protein